MSAEDTLTNVLCSGFPFGPYDEETGFFTQCFIDVVLLSIALLYFAIVGIIRIVKLRRLKPRLYPQSKVHIFEIAACTLMCISGIVGTFAFYLLDNEVPTYKVVTELINSLAWLFSLFIIVMEYNRGQAHNWVVISWWMSSFLIQSLQIQAIVKEDRDVKSRNFDLGQTIAEFVFTSALGLSALFCNQLPPPTYTNLNGTAYTFEGEELDEVSLLQSEDPESQDKPKNDEEQVPLDDDDDDILMNNHVSSSTTKQKPRRIKSPEEKANLLSRLIFSWLSPLLRVGYKRPLTEKDLYPLSAQDETHRIGDELERAWMNQVHGSSPSFTKAILSVFLFPFALGGLLKLIQDSLLFAGPFLLEQVILFVKTPEQPLWHGIAYAVLMCLASIIQSLALHQYFFRVFRVGMHLRAGIVSLVYRKAFRMSYSARQSYTVGEIVNLQSIDASRLEGITPYLHMIWSAPFQIIVAIILLWRVVGWTVVGGLAVMIILIPINLKVGKVMGGYQKTMMNIKDNRNKATNEALQGIRVIKFFAWEESFIDKIRGIRNEELAVLRKSSYTKAATQFIWSGSPLLVSLATFSLYALSGHALTAEKAFTALALFNILRFPINMLPNVITSLIEAKISVDRLQKFLVAEELDANAVNRGSSAEEIAISVTGGEFEWKPGERTLRNINLEVKRGQLVAVVGEVGSGKSSLLSALLGDIPKVSGRVTLNGSVAYCPQQAWIQNATLRNNITFGRAYNHEAYSHAIDSVELKPDISILPGGDETEIGEKGINLSGGQKQRVSLARAVYQDADIYLLDDPLSACDASTGKAIFQNCIKGTLAGKTRILVTHQLQYLRDADLVVYMKGGQFVEVGTWTELISANGEFAKMVLDHVNTEHTEPETSASASTSAATAAASPSKEVTMDSTPTTGRKPGKEDKKSKLIAAEEKEEGSVKASVYLAYVTAIGGILMGSMIILAFCAEFAFRMGADWWLSNWSNAEDNDQHIAYYLGIYAGLGLANVGMVFVRSFVIVIGTLRAATNLHDKMLRTVFRAKTSFFDTTPIGRILNRFSKDTYAIDESLPRTMTSALSTLFQVFSVIIIIFSVTPWFLVLLLPLAFFYRRIQQQYLRSSRELQRLNSLSRSPIFAAFSETINGLTTIRAYKKEALFTADNERRVDENQKAYFLVTTANRWLGLRLEVVGTTVVFGATFLAVMNRDTIAAGLAGLSITYALQLTSTLNWLVRMSTDVENELVSVERIEQYTKLPVEPAPIVYPRPPDDWPSKGEIVFEDLSLRYRPELPLVLKHISCKIKGGEKIGIVGRTGSGKSSAMVALFRHVEPEAGRIIIDGIDIHSQVGLDDLRSRLAIIPQDPTLFTGTIRSNLDPFNKYDDNALWRVLEVTGLKSQIEQREGGLYSVVTENGENLSVGTRQLLCLARAVLRNPKILVLDEATANISYAEDAVIQATIREQFKNATVLTIAHRINTILDSDRVLVLDKGEIKEFDKPSVLLANPNSLFSMLVKKSQATMKNKPGTEASEVPNGLPDEDTLIS